MAKQGPVDTAIGVAVLWLLGFALSSIGSLAIDPGTPFWGIGLPLLLVGIAASLGIPLYRMTHGWVRWVVLAIHLALPLYVGLVAISFQMQYPF